MAELVLTDAYLTVAGTDLSDHVTSVTLSDGGSIQENTAMGATYVTRIGGLKDWSLSVEFNQDYASSSVDAILAAAVNVSTAIVLRPTSAATSTTNPQWSGNAFLEGYDPIAGSVGDVAKTSPTFVGNGTLTRATA